MWADGMCLCGYSLLLSESTYLSVPPLFGPNPGVRLAREIRFFFFLCCAFLQGVVGVGLPQQWDVLGCCGWQDVAPLNISERADPPELCMCWRRLRSLQEPAVSFQELESEVPSFLS